MKKFFTIGLQTVVLLYAVLHFVTTFWEIDLLLTALSYAGLGIFIFSFLSYSIAKFKLPLFIVSIGLFVLISSKQPIFDGILNGMLQMRNIIGLLVIVPLISWVLHEEPYIEDIMSVFYKFVHTSRRFYLSIVAFTQVIAYFLLFGSISIMYQFTNVVLKEQTTELWERFKGTATLRGFGLSTLWVVSIPSFIFAVETLGASLWLAILQGFGMALIGTLLAVFSMYVHEKRAKVELTPVLQENIQNVLKNASAKHLRKWKVLEFAFLFFTLFGTIFLLHGIFDIQLMIIIPIVIIFWIATFYFVKRKAYKLPSILKEYVKTGLVQQAYQLNIMLAVGVLIFGLRQTQFATIVVDGFQYVETHIPFVNPLFLLPFIVIILGFFGLGPLTVMVLVSGIVSSMNLPYPPELVVLAITSGSVISIILSPVVMAVIVLSASNGLSVITNGIKFNWKYGIAFYLVVQLYIQLRVFFTG